MGQHAYVFGPSLHHDPYVVHVSIEGSGMAARIRAASPEPLLVADAHVCLTPKIGYVRLGLSPCDFG